MQKRREPSIIIRCRFGGCPHRSWFFSTAMTLTSVNQAPNWIILKHFKTTKPNRTQTNQSNPPLSPSLRPISLSLSLSQARVLAGAVFRSHARSEMAVTEEKSASDGRGWGFFKMPFRNSGGNTSSAAATAPFPSGASSSASSHLHHHHHHHHLGYNGPHGDGSGQIQLATPSVSSVAKSFLPTKRRLKLDPPAKLYFPYEPGKQVRSAIKIKNTSKSHVAFKFQTTAPKSCFMRPPGAILAPGETIIATVFKFVEPPENNEKPMDQRSRVKFKIMSLKVKGPMDYVPELFDEQKDHVSVEQILRVVFLDPERPNPALDKLKRQLAEADAAVEARKKPPEDSGPKIIGEGLVIDEWKERRERYLAQQQGEGVDSA